MLNQGPVLEKTNPVQFLAYYVHDLSPFLIQFSDAWGVRYYGLAYLLAFVAGFYLTKWLAVHGYSQLKPEQVGDFIFGGAIFGVVLGGRLGYMLFYQLGTFLSDPLVFFRINEGGMSAHGGIFGLALFSLWFAWKHKLAWLNLGDSLVVVAPIGLFLGRIANFINGELYGRVTSVAWAVQFPKELYESTPEMRQLAVGEAMSLNPAWTSIDALVAASRVSPQLQEQLAMTLSPRHPSQIYEALLEGLVLFVVLWLMRTKLRLPDGVLTGCFFIGYAVLRSFCELFREPDAALTGVLTRGQFLSLWLVFIGIAFLLVAFRNKLASGKPSG